MFGGTTTVAWTVRNADTLAAAGGWTDRVYLSSSATPGGRLLGTFATTDVLAAGTSVPRSATVTIPAAAIGTFYLVVATDDPNRVVEPAAEANNTDGHVLTVDLSPFADLAVTAAAAPNLVIGDPARVTVTWTVKNVNDAAGRTDTWVDRLVAVAANGAETVLGEFTRTGGLAPGASDTRTESLLLPPGMTGRYTLVVRTDATGAVFENGREANNALAAPGDFDVMPIPYADLVVTSVRAGGAARGGPLTVSWRVANDGTGLTSVGPWADRVYLARDPQGTRKIAGTDTGFEHLGFLAVGDGYDRTGTVAVPNGLTGTVYAVVVPADPDATRGNPPPFEFVYAPATRRCPARSGWPRARPPTWSCPRSAAPRRPPRTAPST